MATIRAYTTIEQSRKLAKILPLESADMMYIMYCNGEKPQNGDANLSTVYESDDHKWYWVDIIDGSWDMRIGEDIPCWSLAALINMLPKRFRLLKRNKITYYAKIGVLGNSKTTKFYDNPIDACYEMIIKLHKLNLL